MDARRFDRNADQIAQILNHYRRIRSTSLIPFQDDNDMLLQKAITMLDHVLQINDTIAELAQKGLL